MKSNLKNFEDKQKENNEYSDETNLCECDSDSMTIVMRISRESPKVVHEELIQVMSV